jgi:hypothetical protein
MLKKDTTKAQKFQENDKNEGTVIKSYGDFMETLSKTPSISDQ